MNNGEAYSEGTYVAAFKRVRNQIRKFYAPDIIRLALGRLHSHRQGDIECLRRQPPWFLLLLIKWTLLYGEFVREKMRYLSESDFNRILNLLHDVDDSLRPPSQYGNPRMFLRSMAYQQLWHQEGPSRLRIGRQDILFRELDVSHRFRMWFVEQTGIGIDAWMDLSFMLLAAFLRDDRGAITAAYFSPVKDVYSVDQVDKFLKCMSRTQEELRGYLRALHEDRRRDSSEFRERSPLVRFPLIKLDGVYYRYSLPVLLHSVENFLYDTLRERDPQGFMDAFGPIFERYVQRGMEYLGEPFLTESTIMREARGSKAVDFAILGDQVNILIDAKGIEMSHGGMTSHRPEVITGQAKSSVLKGIRQGIETAQLLSKNDPARWSREMNFLLIVTYKELYLGTGADFFEYVVQERVASALGGAVDECIIPLEHMYFVSIDEFDYLVEASLVNNVRLGTLLGEVSIADQSRETKCLQISQHLVKRWGTLSAPAYIDSAFDALVDRAARALGIDTLRG